MTETLETGRPNQRLRTRKELLRAAARLLHDGKTPSLEEVAEAALVSRATAYRYFASAEQLLLEAAVDIATPEPDAVFRTDSGADPVQRLERADAALSAMIAANEVPLRLMLAKSIERGIRTNEEDEPPIRQNRREALIEAALAPARKAFARGDYELLSAALALVIGTEAMIVFRDVLQMSDADAKKVKRFAIRALVTAARKE